MIITEYDFSGDDIEIKVFGKDKKEYEIHFLPDDKFNLWCDEDTLRKLAVAISKTIDIYDIAEVYREAEDIANEMRDEDDGEI
jgi:hypothetical protein